MGRIRTSFRRETSEISRFSSIRSNNSTGRSGGCRHPIGGGAERSVPTFPRHNPDGVGICSPAVTPSLTYALNSAIWRGRASEVEIEGGVRKGYSRFRRSPHVRLIIVYYRTSTVSAHCGRYSTITPSDHEGS
jgi:hypothetical protein